MYVRSWRAQYCTYVLHVACDMYVMVYTWAHICVDFAWHAHTAHVTYKHDVTPALMGGGVLACLMFYSHVPPAGRGLPLPLRPPPGPGQGGGAAR